MGMSIRSLSGRRARRKPYLPDIQFDELFALVMELPARQPASGQPRRLDALFRELSATSPVRDPDETEDMIWAHWIAHRNARACTAMAAAIEAMGAGAFDLARPILDDLIAAQPDWSEAWNKRSILAFIEKRDAQALIDIEQTLLLEPRHFGAVSGFGQICLRHGRMTEARASFQIALAINPHLEGVREVVSQLGTLPRSDLH
jgi:predicted Zn-dependent protease